MGVIAVVNQKGGVAKTTSSINLGSCLAEMGHKVLLVDLDPQHNLTFGLGYDAPGKTVYECLTAEEELPVYPTAYKNLYICPSNIKLANAELELAGVMGREMLLRDAFTKLNQQFDYVLLDCNHSLGLLTLNALTACDSVIIPLDAGVFALEGINQLVKIIQLVKKKLNNKIGIKGVLLTKVDSKTKLSKQFKEQLELIFKDKVFNTVIHQNVKLAEAQAHQQPINYFDRTSRGHKDYMEVAKELVQRG